jgi:hypothetical protein
MSFDLQYTRIERMLHGMAFAGVGLQKNISEIEGMVFARQLADVTPAPPTFVSSLPRAGTTLLLESLCASGEFATHTYREMPFLFCPLLWSQISTPFRKTQSLRERAHGDGMMVGYDSPEAFEEVFWRAYWPEKYAADRIQVWSSEDRDVDDEFLGFFMQHMRKLVALRRGQGGIEASRYISKNNGNIARFSAISAMSPDAVILTPFREPIDHVRSLLRQHLNFSEIHRREIFARDYMRSIGHLDFGANLKPVNFGGWMDGPLPTPDTLEFWLTYWCATFEHLLAHRDARVNFISYERLCADPVGGLTRIAEVAGVRGRAFVERESGKYEDRSRPQDCAAASQLIDRAKSIHEALLKVSIV